MMMQQRQSPKARPPSRLAYNKQNIESELNMLKKPVSLNNKQSSTKYEIYFPKQILKRKPFFDQPQNVQPIIGLKIVKSNKSFSNIENPVKKIIEDVKKRLCDDDSQKNQQLMKKRKSTIGAEAYIPTNLKELRLIVKKR